MLESTDLLFSHLLLNNMFSLLLPSWISLCFHKLRMILSHQHLFLQCACTGCRIGKDSKTWQTLRFLTVSASQVFAINLSPSNWGFRTEFLPGQVSGYLLSTKLNRNTLTRSLGRNRQNVEQDNRLKPLLPCPWIHRLLWGFSFSGSPAVLWLLSFSSIQMETMNSSPPWNFFVWF